MRIKKGNTRNHRVSSSADDCQVVAGIDILERARIRKAITDYGERFVKKIFTKREIKNFPENRELYYSIGFSLKEAFWKTLPSDIQKKTYFDDIEIIWKRKKPEIFLSGIKAKNTDVSCIYSRKLILSYIIRHLKS